jgi:hypothetical protein
LHNQPQVREAIDPLLWRLFEIEVLEPLRRTARTRRVYGPDGTTTVETYDPAKQPYSVEKVYFQKEEMSYGAAGNVWAGSYVSKAPASPPPQLDPKMREMAIRSLGAQDDMLAAAKEQHDSAAYWRWYWKLLLSELEELATTRERMSHGVLHIIGDVFDQTAPTITVTEQGVDVSIRPLRSRHHAFFDEGRHASLHKLLKRFVSLYPRCVATLINEHGEIMLEYGTFIGGTREYTLTFVDEPIPRQPTWHHAEDDYPGRTPQPNWL